MTDATFRVGLLRALANPDAVSGAGFVATGPPNTNARVSGDFGSGKPAVQREHVARRVSDDTVNSASATYDLFLHEVQVSRSGP